MPRMPGPTCGYNQPANLNDGTSSLIVSPRPGPAATYPTAPAVPRPQGGLAFLGGTPTEEAKSLLRPCYPHGEFSSHPTSSTDYGTPLRSLPEFLNKNVGMKVEIPLLKFQKYLKEAGISDADLGGLLTTPLPAARYFVIHDTSYKFSNTLQTFPASINTSAYVHNQLKTLKTKRDAHVFISRTGISNTAHDFSVPYSATKYTNVGQGPAAVQLKSKFCHTELVQPRLGLPGHPNSDWMAPNPGFPDVQIARLALVYIAASFRHDEWLIPAYHHNIDMGFANGHDDPQNFDLEGWSSRIAETVKQIISGLGNRDFEIRSGFGNAG